MNLKSLFAIVLLTFAVTQTSARAQRGYIKKNGSYVAPHFKSAPDGKRYNNYGSKSNGGRQRDEFSSPPKYNKRK